MKLPGNLGNIMKQAQKMQEDMKNIQKELETKVIEASAGGDMVTVKINGANEIVSVKIKPEIVNSEDIEMLEDLIVAAVNEGLRKVKEMTTEEMSKLTGGLNIPGLDGLF